MYVQFIHLSFKIYNIKLTCENFVTIGNRVLENTINNFHVYSFFYYFL